MEDTGFEMESLEGADQTDVVDLSEAETEDTQDATEVNEDGAQDEGEKAEEPADPQPAQKTVQTPEENAKFASARKSAEAETKAMQQRQDKFAQGLGYKDFTDMEHQHAVRQYTEGGMSEAAAQQMYEMQARLQQLESERAEATQREQSQAEWVKVMQAYPETADAKFKMPQEVLDAVDAGETPLHAFNAYEVKRLREHAATAKQNADNKQKAIGPLKGAAQPKTKADSFTAGLFS